jgi:hypothetical protein
MSLTVAPAAEETTWATLWRWVRRLRNLIGFLLSLWLASFMLWNTVLVDGDVSCDFAGQWLMGRAFYEGWMEMDLAQGDWPRQTRQLYLPVPMLQLLRRGYGPDAYGSNYKDQVVSDLTYQILRKGYSKPSSQLRPADYAQHFVSLAPPLAMLTPLPLADLPWKLLEDLATEHARLINPIIEGPLYPPTAGLLFMPLGLMPPKAAHIVANVLYLQMVVLCGWLLALITDRRLVWGEATLLILAFPNTYQTILLGQNSVLSLTILLGGWALLVRGRPMLAGLVWGLFAYKPVFAVALLLVPVALLQLRLLAGMAAGGGLMVALTLPFTGVAGLERFWQGRTPPTYENAHEINPWERWLIVGQHATLMYSYDRNWIWMSRDLRGLARRRMWTREDAQRHLLIARHRYLHGVDFHVRSVSVSELRNLLGHAPRWPNDGNDDGPVHDPQSPRHWERYLMRSGPTLPGDHGEDRFNLRIKPEFWDQAVQRVYASDKEVHAFGWTTDQWTSFIGNTLIALIGSVTVLSTWLLRLRLRRRGISLARPFTGMGAVFVLTGALLTCFHFMHYDCLLFALPVALALAAFPELSWIGRGMILLITTGLVLGNYDMSVANGICRPPIETFLLLLLWSWSGLAAWREARQEKQKFPREESSRHSPWPFPGSGS